MITQDLSHARFSGPPPLCILGLGLIGGSLLRAAKQAGYSCWGYNRSQVTVDHARVEGFDVSTDLREVLTRAHHTQALIVVAVPGPALPDMFDAIAQYAHQCTLTDVVSVKQPIQQLVAQLDLAHNFVGGHPMAGTAQSGWSATDTDLFRGARWMLSVDQAVNPIRFQEVARLVFATGAVVVPLLAEDHDRVVARISHLPHITAATTAATALRDPLALVAKTLAASSFRDATRVAATDPSLTQAMVEANQQAVLEELDIYIDQLQTARNTLAAQNSLNKLLSQGYRARLDYQEWNSPGKNHHITQVPWDLPSWREFLTENGKAGRVLAQL